MKVAKAKRVDNKGRILKDGESQRPNGTYRFRYVDANGVRRDVYSSRLLPTDKMPAHCKDDLSLREKEKAILRDLEDGVKTAVENKLTLNELFDLYIEGKKELKESTRVNYMYMYRKYVRDGLGRKKVTTIRYSDIRTFYNRLLSENGFQPNSLETIHTILHPVFTLAVRDGYIRVNPTDGIMADIKRSHSWEKPKRHALSVQEQEAFVSYVANSSQYAHWLPLFTVFLGTGCRVGEVLGLRWEDIDFDRMTIQINHNLIYRLQENGECKFRVTTPKTKSGIREIPMMEEVRDALLEERERQREFGPNTATVDGYTDFVFTNRFGMVYSPHVINRAIERIIKSYNVEETERAKEEEREPLLIRHFSCHNLRHTFCTRFCENETNLKVIQDIMGHADISTTMNIYAEATHEKKKQSLDQLSGKMRIR